MNDSVSAGLKAKLIAHAKAVGFDAIGITRPGAIRAAGAHLQQFLSLGRHGDMDWLQEKADRRSNPQTLWPEVQSIIMLGMNYGPAGDPMDKLSLRNNANISCYAQGRDYHDVIKQRLKQLARWLHQESGAEVKVFVDTAPVMEKPLAEAAAIGWQGKHTNLVSREFGSWLFLGAIYTTLVLPYDAPEADHCGTCQACLDICPTRAFTGPRQLDARRCISYLTIEHKGHIAREFRKPMGNRVYGCDDCLAVCPWNKWAQTTKVTAFHPQTDLTQQLRAMLQLDDAAFRRRFSGSPVKRTGRSRFIRNCLIAAANSADVSLLDVIVPLLGDGSALVRAMAVWAVRQLAPEAMQNALRAQSLVIEVDAEVRAEWG